MIALVVGPAPALAQSATVAERARLVLEKYCISCHGSGQASGLDAREREGAIKGGKRGPAVIPGQAEQSLLYQAAAHLGELRMPPGSKTPLGSEDLNALRRWIDEGFTWPTSAARKQTHWAFEPVRKATPPADPDGWSQHPVDRFIRAKLREKGLQPVGPADRRSLLRRACFDLIGLPPSPEEIKAFVSDSSPAAFEKVVDRLLASPQYGERWGRHWMDVVRYADTAGDNADYPLPEIRLYRDYIIDSFNADKPYDQFVREQLAGDILAQQGSSEQRPERVIATGFLALSRRYATAPYELWHLTLEDTIETVGRSFMGLTLRCARCHDHKFDPVTNRDYYALYGIFASTRFAFGGSEEFQSQDKFRDAFVPLADQAGPSLEEYRKTVTSLREQVTRIEKEHPLAKTVEDLDRQIESKTKSIQALNGTGHPSGTLETERAALQKRRDDTLRQLMADKNDGGEPLDQLPEKLRNLRLQMRRIGRAGLPEGMPGVYGVQEGKVENVTVQLHGEPEEKGPVVPRNVPLFLNGGQPVAIPDNSSGRLELARWLTQPEHPLTARVMVNRIWQHHFGRGLVGTTSNFGTRGDAPTHPELLDWLAATFVENGWSVKSMHRLIMLSQTYQLASENDEAGAARDAANQWYWHFARRRLEAEPIRDTMLALGGNLDLSRPGRHPFPAIDEWNWTQHKPFKAVYDSNHRSVYLMTQRLLRHPYLALFDGPDTNYTTGERTSSTVPLQALYLMNNPFVRDQAGGFARRLIGFSPDAQRRIELGCELAWGRAPSTSEVGKFEAYLEQYRREAQSKGIPAEALELETWSSFTRILLTSNEFMFVD